MKLSTVKIELTEEELGFIREAIDNLKEIEDRLNEGTQPRERIYREIYEIEHYLGQAIIQRMKQIPF